MNNPNIAALVKSEKNARKRMRYLASLHFNEGHSRTAIASMVKVSRTSVNRWITPYLAQGLTGLDYMPNLGRPATLSTQHNKPSSKRSYSTKVYRQVDGQGRRPFYPAFGRHALVIMDGAG